MKRTILNVTVMLTAATVVATSAAFADSKGRVGGNFNRSQTTSSGGQSTHSFSGRLGATTGHNPTQNNNGSGKQSGMTSTPRNLGGAHFSGVLSQPQGTKARHITVQGNSSHSSASSPLSLPGGLSHVTKPEVRGTIPSNIHNQTGKKTHQVLMPNGTMVKPIALDAAKFVQHKGLKPNLPPQVQNIVASAPKHLCIHPHFSWWVNICHDHCHTNYGCWNVHNRYWDSWTTCNWQVVQCQQFSYFVGLSCIHIADMQAYGVQTVVNGSPAQLAGLQSGDLILTVNGQSVFDQNLMNAEIVRGRLDLQVIREGAPAAILITVFPRLVQSVSF